MHNTCFLKHFKGNAVITFIMYEVYVQIKAEETNPKTDKITSIDDMSYLKFNNKMILILILTQLVKV